VESFYAFLDAPIALVLRKANLEGLPKIHEITGFDRQLGRAPLPIASRRFTSSPELLRHGKSRTA
jgi:hypothetical protein